MPRLALSSVLLVLALACGDREAGGTGGAHGTGRGATNGSTVMESAGEVVIASPGARYEGGPVVNGGSVTGSVSTSAQIAVEPPSPTGAAATACGPTIVDSSVQQSGTGLGNVVVWLDGVRKGKSVPLEKRVEIESDHCVLVPRVQIALTGGAINVLAHDDDFRQHLRFLAGGEAAPRASILLGSHEQVIPTELPVKSPGLVIVRDADHPWVRGYIAVFDQPYATVTKADGSFTIDQVPPGTYTLVAWHERTGRTEQKVTVAAGAAAKVAVSLTGAN